MDTVKVAKDYFLSSQSSLLIPNREYGSRKLVQISNVPAPKVPASLSSVPAALSSLPASLSNLPGALSSLARPAVPLRSGPGSVPSGKGKFLPYTLSDSSLPVFRSREGSSRSSASTPSGCGGDGGGGPAAHIGNIMKSSTKQWMHPQETLIKGHILYNVKFLGECAVDQPKGTEVVKDAIRKMKFHRPLKRAETGQKPPKVQLCISVDGVTIQDPKTKTTMHQYPLHRISYCADDKSDKKMFTFIAKAATTTDHYCYVFSCSDKSAEEITLTVGQAFDLAYKRFLEEGTNGTQGAGGETDYKKMFLLQQRRVNSLQFENDALRKRVAELEKLKDRSDLEEYMKNNQVASLTTVTLSLREHSEDETDETSDDFEPPTQPQKQHSMVGRRLENLIFDTPHANGSFSPSPSSSGAPAPLLSPPPPSSRHHRQLVSSLSSPGPASPSPSVAAPVKQQSFGDVPSSSDPFGFAGASSDPFGMGAFNPSNGASPRGSGFGPSAQQERMDIQAGFSRGLSFGTDDFNLDDLDPLSQSHRL